MKVSTVNSLTGQLPLKDVFCKYKIYRYSKTFQPIIKMQNYNVFLLVLASEPGNILDLRVI